MADNTKSYSDASRPTHQYLNAVVNDVTGTTKSRIRQFATMENVDCLRDILAVANKLSKKDGIDNLVSTSHGLRMSLINPTLQTVKYEERMEKIDSAFMDGMPIDEADPDYMFYKDIGSWNAYIRNINDAAEFWRNRKVINVDIQAVVEDLRDSIERVSLLSMYLESFIMSQQALADAEALRSNNIASYKLDIQSDNNMMELGRFVLDRYETVTDAPSGDLLEDDAFDLVSDEVIAKHIEDFYPVDDIDALGDDILLFDEWE